MVHPAKMVNYRAPFRTLGILGKIAATLRVNFMIGGKQNLSKSLISFKPAVGDFYIFPGWLLHGAEPFRGEGERRSMAFNADIEYADN